MLGVNVPLPNVAHVTCPVVEVAFKLIFGLFLQTNCVFGPPLTTGAGKKVMSMVSLEGKQLPLPVVV